MADVTVVPATGSDIRSFPRAREFDETTLRLALESAEEGCAWAARDESETIGWALARSCEMRRTVGEVFVEPSFRGQGVGDRLLEAALAGADASRWLLFDPADRAAFALAARRRLVPFATFVRFAGSIPGEDVLLQLAASSYRFDVDAIDATAHGYALDELDRSTVGIVRRDEHRRYAGETIGIGFFSAGEFVAYAYVWQDGRIGPAAAASAAYASQTFAYAMLTLRRSFGATWCTALIASSASRLTRAALHAGLRIDATLALAGSETDADLSRYIARDRLAL